MDSSSKTCRTCSFRADQTDTPRKMEGATCLVFGRWSSNRPFSTSMIVSRECRPKPKPLGAGVKLGRFEVVAATLSLDKKQSHKTPWVGGESQDLPGQVVHMFSRKWLAMNSASVKLCVLNHKSFFQRGNHSGNCTCSIRCSAS